MPCQKRFAGDLRSVGYPSARRRIKSGGGTLSLTQSEDREKAAMPEDQAKPGGSRLGAGGVLLLIALAAFLLMAIGLSVYAWNLFPGTQLSTNGTIAMVLGIVFATAVGIGLMGLLFWSSRKGYDR
jgi:hypothetical protein